MSQRLPPIIKKALEATGLPWNIVYGSKHRKIYLQGRFAAILPSGNIKERDRGTRNTVSDIRNVARQFHMEHSS